MPRSRKLLAIWLIAASLVAAVATAWMGLAVAAGVLAVLVACVPDRPRRARPVARLPAARQLASGVVTALPDPPLVISGGRAVRAALCEPVIDADPARVRELEADTCRPMDEVIADAERKAERIHLASLPPLTDRAERIEQIRAEIQCADEPFSSGQLLSELAALSEIERRMEVIRPYGVIRLTRRQPDSGHWR